VFQKIFFLGISCHPKIYPKQKMYFYTSQTGFNSDRDCYWSMHVYKLQLYDKQFRDDDSHFTSSKEEQAQVLEKYPFYASKLVH
jgi:hypothetical protein